jgi:glucose/mannose-6-phosphate isomerase
MSNNQLQYDALSKFSHQIRFALDNFTSHGVDISNYNNIVIGGLGGSGIGGRIVKGFMTDKIKLPIEVVSDYHLPAYADHKTILVLGSYSGNTEETLTMFELGKQAQCKMIVLTSGGKLKDLAEKESLKIYPIESGFQPRMALGYSLTYMLLIFGEFIGIDYKEDLNNIASSLDHSDEYLIAAEEIYKSTLKHLDKKTIVVTDAGFEAVGIRFAQQIQENAKAEAFVCVLPEANHNIIESYYGQLPSVFVFIHADTNERVSQRFEFLRSMLEVENNKIIDIHVDSFDLYTIYEIIYRLDYYSLLVADYRGVDALNVPNIMELKGFLDDVK